MRRILLLVLLLLPGCAPTSKTDILALLIVGGVWAAFLGYCFKPEAAAAELAKEDDDEEDDDEDDPPGTGGVILPAT